ncbi:cardiolipin synthase [Siansivirga zeaxanthinifaciens]|uniref:Cardiolipin synthase n=1 Tax=Siansivirga zeaxanthinifaciens CC-SAMT-1 TaxID=1454006 RepID=A0A0C5WE22_9FLAO|nr:cardiolipin synthase [Siansivirga zeaxanthinifaciens]AJR03484.1 cardiolipin synthetase [Siansivirga zeaxanthinifaciens CC-SAMT-1]
MIEFLKEYFWTILLLVNYIIGFSAAITILLKNINPTKTLTYVIVLVFFPFLGIIVYYLFGQEYRKNKIFSRKRILNEVIVKEINDNLELNQTDLNKINADLNDKIKLVKLLHNNGKSKLTLNNEVKLFVNGNDKFELLLKDLESAQNFIHLEYYIIKDDTIGNKLIKILCDKAKAGVNVRLSVDGVGSELSAKAIQTLKASGVEIYKFMPVFFPKFTGKMNYRDHRKIAIIDGLIGYVGGMNISDEYLNYKNDKQFWRDTHLRIVGDAVAMLQIHFLTTWDFVSNNKTKIQSNFFPESKTSKNTKLQIAASGPDTDWACIKQALIMAINTATEYIYITTPYFIPSPEIITALQIAEKSGVDVRILIPEKSDSWIAKHATDSYLQTCLESNIKIYLYTKGFIHSKTQVLDDAVSSIGTANLDYRSLNINFEINAFVYCTEFSKSLKAQFLEDLKTSKQITLEGWHKRSKSKKLKESFCRLWAPLL